MNKMTKKALATLAAVACVCGVASAQTSTVDAYPYGISVRFGVGFPIDDNYSNMANTLIGAGIEYQLRSPIFKGGESYISLDYFTKDTSGSNGTVFPLLINHRFYTGSKATGNRTYAFLGLGVSFVDDGASTSVISGKAGLGMELGERIFAEGAVYLGDRASTIRPNALALYVGYRF
jgi:hypothetical protein